MSATDQFPIIRHGQGRDDDMDGGGVIAWAVVLFCLAGMIAAGYCITRAMS